MYCNIHLSTSYLRFSGLPVSYEDSLFIIESKTYLLLRLVVCSALKNRQSEISVLDY